MVAVPSVRRHAPILTILSFIFICYICSEQITSSSRKAFAQLPAIGDIITKLPGQTEGLLPFVLEPLPLGSIKPSGWLRDQMQLMAAGLAGHEYDFYDYVAHSKWVGGDKEYSALNEGFPYWFNGLVPLAYGLDNDRLKVQVHTAAHHILDNQAEDGWLGPEVDTDRLLWARFPLCLGLIQLAEANATWFNPIVDALHKFNGLLNTLLLDDGLTYVRQSAGEWHPNIFTWGRVRNADMIITLQWLYEHHLANSSAMLLGNMNRLHDNGLKWEHWYAEDTYFGRHMHENLYTLPENDTLPFFHFEHGVNVAQGLKSPAVVRRFKYSKSLIATAKNAVNWTLLYHGATSGTIIGDERIVGLSPWSGSELCTSVELMYSLAYLHHASGDPFYADKAELAAFNSLPAMFTPDYWAHQYVQSANQISAKQHLNTTFYNTNSWSQSFGLEPHYPCCTVNHPQGWPKFLSHSFAKVGVNGIAHTLLSPGIVSTTLRSGRITVEARTAYPFNDTLEYIVMTDGAADLYLRVPSWATEESSITIDSGTRSTLRPDGGTGLHKVALTAGPSRISYSLQSEIRLEPRANDTVAVYKGALLYAIQIKHTRTSTKPKAFRDPHDFYADDYAPDKVRDWEYKSATDWDLAIDTTTLHFHMPSLVPPTHASIPIFEEDANVGYMTAQGCKIDWPLLEDGVPGAPPVAEARPCVGNQVEVKLIPYGSTKLRIAEIPVIRLRQDEG